MKFPSRLFARLSHQRKLLKLSNPIAENFPLIPVAVKDVVSGPIPLESRIIAVCDAFDSMIYDHVYRRGVSTEEAVRELQRCSPRQFDPDVVELLADYVGSATFQNTWLAKVADSKISRDDDLEQHLNSLSEAIEAEDVEKIRNIVDLLKLDAEHAESPVISAATQRLNEAITVRNAEFDQIIELANEVMDLCGSTRNSVAQPVDSAVLTETTTRQSG